MKATKRFILLMVFCVSPFVDFCGNPVFSTKKKSSHGLRFQFGPSLGLYTLNTKHAINPTQRISLLVGLKHEWRADRSFRTFFSAGLDYFLHGVNFKSYYFTNDSLQLYDRSFAYHYALFIHEAQVPLQLKFLFKRADNSEYSPYAIVGFHLRYLMGSSLQVSDNGNTVKKDSPELDFKTPLFTSHMNSFLSLGLGWQKNSRSASKNNFFMEASFRTGISPYGFQTAYSASSLYISSAHALFLLGFKF